MSSLIEFLSNNAVLVGGIAFFGMLFSMGSTTERVVLLFAGASILTFSFGHSIDAALGVLALGGILLLTDHIRARA